MESMMSISVEHHPVLPERLFSNSLFPQQILCDGLYVSARVAAIHREDLNPRSDSQSIRDFSEVSGFRLSFAVNGDFRSVPADSVSEHRKAFLELRLIGISAFEPLDGELRLLVFTGEHCKRNAAPALCCLFIEEPAPAVFLLCVVHGVWC